MYCKKCGKKLSDHAKFCRYCGWQISGNENKTEPVKKDPKPPVKKTVKEPAKKGGRKNRAVVVAAVVVLLLLLTGGGIWLVFESDLMEDMFAGRNRTHVRTDSREQTKEEEKEPEESEEETPSEPEESESEDVSSEEEPEESVETEEMESEYFIPYSDSRYLTMDELEGMTEEECRLARNELYARHGRKFTDENLQSYFDGCSWYEGTIEADDFNDSMLNEYEVANRDLIVQYEKEQGYR